ncbi:MAG: deoxyribose-phosphate aldolase [Proteobacteria bacterium]|nr:deoxyribose-phosphate aldolase [Pseudomonadota bacterium]MBT6069826.1 deoxyribose-phosphate aldolase [Pseudomonadota bacterium]
MKNLPSRVNPTSPLDLDWLGHVRVNRSAIERRVLSLAGRRTVKKEWQAAWLLRAMTCIDLTTLDGADTLGNVQRLCAKARMPLRSDIAMALSATDLKVGAVCVYPALVTPAVSALEGSDILVASVAAGFPDGLTPLQTRIDEVRGAYEAGASEIDIVIRRGLALTEDWMRLYDEICAFREAAGDAHLKTILGTGNLASFSNISKASLVAMMAGADFIKTSTGKEGVNANLPVSLVMLRAIRDFYNTTGTRVGFKPAGGIRKSKDAIAYLILIQEELGKDWLSSRFFRLGASGLLGDISRQLEFFLTGEYSASHRHAIG